MIVCFGVQNSNCLPSLKEIRYYQIITKFDLGEKAIGGGVEVQVAINVEEITIQYLLRYFHQM